MLAKLDAALAGGRPRPGLDPPLGGGDGPARRRAPARTPKATAPDALGNGDHPLTGTPEAVAAGLRRYFDLGCDHVQVQLRPNSLEGVRAFAPVLEALRAGAGVARHGRQGRGERRAAGRPGATPSVPRRVRRGG